MSSLWAKEDPNGSCPFKVSSAIVCCWACWAWLIKALQPYVVQVWLHPPPLDEAIVIGRWRRNMEKRHPNNGKIRQELSVRTENYICIYIYICIYLCTIIINYIHYIHVCSCLHAWTILNYSTLGSAALQSRPTDDHTDHLNSPFQTLRLIDLHSTCRDWPQAQRQTTLLHVKPSVGQRVARNAAQRGSNFSPDMPCLGKTCRSHSIAGWFCKQVVERIGGLRYWWNHYAWIKNMRQCWSICSTSWKPALRSNGTTIRWTSFWIFLDHPPKAAAWRHALAS